MLYSFYAQLVAQLVGADDKVLLTQKDSAKRSDWGHILSELETALTRTCWVKRAPLRLTWATSGWNARQDG